MVKVEFNHFAELWFGERDTIKIEGFKIKNDGIKVLVDEIVGRAKFVPHEIKYYKTVIEKIKEMI